MRPCSKGTRPSSSIPHRYRRAFAILHIGLGNLDRALDWAERAYDEKRGWLAYLNVNPMLDPLRNESRFKSLLQKMRL